MIMPEFGFPSRRNPVRCAGGFVEGAMAQQSRQL
jgi:hypothetical protein